MLDHLDCMQVSTPVSPGPTVSSPSPYTVGPIDPAHLITLHVHLCEEETCTLLVPNALPLWIRNHPEFRDGYERNFFSEEGEEDTEWSTVLHTINLLYSKLLGEGFKDPFSGALEPEFGAWEIGWLLRDFTRLAVTDPTLAFTAIAHLCFLVSFLPLEPPGCWPPAGLVCARWQHNDAVKVFRAQVRVYREQGKSYDKAQRLVLHACAR